MLLNVEVVEAVAGFIAEAKIPAVIDPVMVASSGATLLSAEAVAAVARKLLPLAAVVTPNLDEATILLGRKALGGTQGPAEALELARRYGVPFLVKGGHAEETHSSMPWLGPTVARSRSRPGASPASIRTAADARFRPPSRHT